MSEQLLRLSTGDLRDLASALRSGRLPVPVTGVSLGWLLRDEICDTVAAELRGLGDPGADGLALAMILDLLIRDRTLRPNVEEAIDLVTTGPEAAGIANRDTAVVVRELFSSARESVLVAGYAVYQGRRVFEALAERMREVPELRVRMFLDIQRGPGDTTKASDLVHRFLERFRTREWPPNVRAPEIYYDPRSLELAADRRACLHAKTIVVDGQHAFVSSANLTEAAHERNIELGLLVHSTSLAGRIVRHFDALVGEQLLLPAV